MCQCAHKVYCNGFYLGLQENQSSWEEACALCGNDEWADTYPIPIEQFEFSLTESRRSIENCVYRNFRRSLVQKFHFIRITKMSNINRVNVSILTLF